MLGEKPLKQQEDWEAQKLGLTYFKKAVRRAKRDSRHSFVGARIVKHQRLGWLKIFQRN